MISNRQGGRRRGRGGGQPRGISPGPGNRQDNRQRGNAAQLLEKYKGLARDAQLQGDRVQTEYFLQYADHYFRVLGESRARFEEQRRQRDEDDGDDEERELETSESGSRDDRREDGDAGDGGEGRKDRPRRFERDDRPERSARFERDDRGDRNGEFRGRRARGSRRGEEEQEGADERIAFDSLPPAIQKGGDDGGEDEAPAAPRARRSRRPRGADEDIAPAA